MLKQIYKKFQDMRVEPIGLEEIRFKYLVISNACYQSLPNCVKQSKSIFHEWMSSPNPDSSYTTM